MSHQQRMAEKYPSLKKIVELGDDYEEWKDGREDRLLEYVKRRPDFDQIKGSPTKVLAAMDDFSNNEDFLISVGVDKAQIITRLLAEEKPKTLVELGGYMGYSAILFAHEMRRLAAPAENIHVWSLEFEPAFAKIIEEFVAIAGLSDFVTVVTGPAAQSLKELKSSKKVDSIDLLFLDHVEDLYEQDFKVAEGLGLLRPGTCVLADNVLRPGAPKYREFVRAHPGLESRAIRGLIMPGELEDEFECSKVL